VGEAAAIPIQCRDSLNRRRENFLADGAVAWLLLTV